MTKRASTVLQHMSNFPNILVLGATGRLGKILRSYWPTGLARWQTRQVAQGPDEVQVDILSDPDGLACAAEGVSVILCLAGIVPAAAARTGTDMADNTALALAALRAAERSHARVFLVSSAAVYGAQTGVFTETQALCPTSAYGVAKRDMETAGAALATSLGVPTCCLRIGNIAGADAILGGWGHGFRLDQFPDGLTPRRSYIGPQTLANVLLRLTQTADLPDVLNIAAPGEVEMGALLDAAGLPWGACPAPDTALPQVCLQTTRLRRYVDLPDQAGSPDRLALEWHDYKTRSGL